MTTLKKDNVLLLFGKLANWGNTVLNIFNTIILILILLYGIFALYDTWAIFRGADVNSGLLKFKPELNIQEEENPTIQELSEKYPDIRAWLTIDDTNIDYPIVQGTDNQKYVNQDIDENFSLSGTIFLDCNNTGDFSDDYNILYGHHMEMEKMFGGLDLFKDEGYMCEHAWGHLFLPNTTLDLEVFATVSADAYDKLLFTPLKDDDIEMQKLLSYIKDISVVYREIDLDTSDRIIAMSTCSSIATNERTLVIAKIK